MSLIAGIQVFGPIEQTNGGLWIAVLGAIGAAWAGLLIWMIQRTRARIVRHRAAIATAERFGGFGHCAAGGHQPVAVRIVGRPVIVGRVQPHATRIIRRQLDDHARSGDPRFRFGLGRTPS